MRTYTKEIGNVNSVLDDIISAYKEDSSQKKRNWHTYEQQVAQRLKVAFQELKPLVHEAASVCFVSGENRGTKHVLSVEQRTLALLIKHLVGKSNRTMSSMFVVFSLLSDIEVSYKTVERFYSDSEVIVVLNNLHALMLKKKNIKDVDGSGDGTGYSLTIKVNYANEAQKLKEKIKEDTTQISKEHKKKLFTYSFRIIDLKSNMYVGFGTSFKSEKQAFLKTIEMIKNLHITLANIRLDKYYSCQEYVKFLKEIFPDIEITLLPKKNATINGCGEWKKMMKDYTTDPVAYLENYFKRNRSESSFSEDKKRTGWQLGQKRVERIETADMITSLWHNLYWLGRS
jgi:transposase